MNWFREEDGKLIWAKNHETVQIQAWENDSLRLRSTLSPKIAERRWALLDNPVKIKPQIEISETGAVIRNGKIKAKISPDGRITYLKSADDSIIMEEQYPGHGAHPYPARNYQPISSELSRLEATFKAYTGERFYGLGQHQHGFLDQKGCVVELFQRNTQVCIPFLVSSRSYGFLWNNPSVGQVELGMNQTRWTAEAARGFDYVIIAGDSYAEIMSRYADITGHVPMMPAWAEGFWQSKLRSKSQEE
jgi:alpha-D-xyloside xylohydrolase